jgi:hypothetical protein
VSRKFFATSKSWKLSPVFSSRNIMVLPLIVFCLTVTFSVLSYLRFTEFLEFIGSYKWSILKKNFCGTRAQTQGLHLKPLYRPFLWWVFQDRVSQTVCLGWLRTSLLLISASWVARITGVSHRCPVPFWKNFGHCVLKDFFSCFWNSNWTY